MKKSVIFTPTLLAILSLLMALQANAGEQVISVQHDSSRKVTCWITPQGGISCLPDRQLGSLPQQATPSSDAGRASQASSAQEKESLVSIPLPQDERFRL
ncbi:hypothetical protein [Pseudomonas parakoreensis]|uniref:hypothetical protein n=1 Tax=Pseudomonas parakoreensis TaxID=2892331 RepID=UPI001F34249A|nr:hypothetical protein [Pseudomonas parakoreensis]